MIVIKHRLAADEPDRHRLCRECVFFVHAGFSVGKCARRDPSYPTSIVDERLSGHCGVSGRFFKTKRAAA